MEHKNSGRHSKKVYRLYELLGKTDGQLFIAELVVLVTLLAGTAVYLLLLYALPDTSAIEGCQIRKRSCFYETDDKTTGICLDRYL